MSLKSLILQYQSHLHMVPLLVTNELLETESWPYNHYIWNVGSVGTIFTSRLIYFVYDSVF